MRAKKRRLLSAVTPASMGGHEDVRKPHEGRVGRKRLGVEHIQACNNVAAPQALQERNAVHDLSPGDVDEDAPGLELVEFACPEHGFGGRGERYEDEDDVTAEDSRQGSELDSAWFGQLSRDEGVVDPHFDLERPQELDQVTTQVAEADQADPLVAQLGTIEARARGRAPARRRSRGRSCGGSWLRRCAARPGRGRAPIRQRAGTNHGSCRPPAHHVVVQPRRRGGMQSGRLPARRAGSTAG